MHFLVLIFWYTSDRYGSIHIIAFNYSSVVQLLRTSYSKDWKFLFNGKIQIFHRPCTFYTLVEAVELLSLLRSESVWWIISKNTLNSSMFCLHVDIPNIIIVTDFSFANIFLWISERLNRCGDVCDLYINRMMIGD